MELIEEGNRIYVTGNTYPIRDALRSVGAKWDPTSKRWWVVPAKRQEVEAVLASNASSTASSSPSNVPGDQAAVAGKARYKGKLYYIAGRVERGRSVWDTRVRPVTGKDGTKTLLYFRDGSSQFWCSTSALTDVKQYTKPHTISGLRRFAERIRENGGTHPNACSYCGSLSCSAAYGRGGMCDED